MPSSWTFRHEQTPSKFECGDGIALWKEVTHAMAAPSPTDDPDTDGMGDEASVGCAADLVPIGLHPIISL